MLNGVAFIVGRLKLGIFIPLVLPDAPAAGFFMPNGEEVPLLPNALVLCAAASFNPVAITVILA